MKATLGDSVKLTKYDMPIRPNMQAPLGTAVFQLQREREFAHLHKNELKEKFMKSISNLKTKKGKDKKHP